MKNLYFKNGDHMPILGLGTLKSKPGEVKQAVIWAIETGYRHIDCAAVYQNEAEVGEGISDAISRGIVKREELFITSKLWNNAHKYDQVIPALKKSLKDLQLDYVDAYLIHWPVSFKENVLFPEKREDFLTYEEAPLHITWKAMQEAKERGLAKHIGLSNFNQEKIAALMEKGGETPEILQIELHPFLHQPELVDYCRKLGIILTAYSPLGSGDSRSDQHKNDPKLLSNPMVLALAEKHHATAGQILIAWSIAREIAVIPKSVNESRIKENFDAAGIILSDEEKMKLKDTGISHRYIDGSFFTGENSPYNTSDLFD